MTMNSLKPMDTAKLSAAPCHSDPKKHVAQLIGNRCTISCNINGVPIEMLLDSRAQVTMVSKT